MLDDANNISTPNTSWFLLKPSKMDCKTNRYKLSPGDIVKIGRITLRIRDIYFLSKKKNTSALNDSFGTNLNKEMNALKTEGAPINNSNLNNNNKNEIIDDKNKNSEVNEKIKPISLPKNFRKSNNNNIITKIEKKNYTCRICYMEEEDNENPLLQPCICSGSMKFIHLSCLKHWISTRSCLKIDSTNNCSVYIIKPVECELCKTKFPDFIRHEDKLYALLDFSKEFENYLTLESLTLDKHKNKFIYVVSLVNNKKMKIGRGHDCDILLSDISVSRVHCFMVVEKKKVFLEDNDSKFGTLLLIQTPNLKIMEGLTLNIQVGRTYIECKIKKPSKLFNCCNVEESSNLYFYYNQNEKQIQEHINLIVGKDYNEINDSVNEINKINNTFNHKYTLNMADKYNYNSMEIEEKDKISDNQYFMIKHNKLNKNLTRALIDEDNESEHLNNKNKKDNEDKEENEGKNDLVNDSKNNNEKNENEIENNNNQEENEMNEDIDQEDIESICISENSHSIKKENNSTLDN